MGQGQIDSGHEHVAVAGGEASPRGYIQGWRAEAGATSGAEKLAPAISSHLRFPSL